MALNLDAIGKRIGPLTRDYTWKDVVLYALGVGAGSEDLEYCYEEQLKVIPSFSVAAIFDFLASAAIGSNADLSGILHGEQDTYFHAPFPTEGTLVTEGAIQNIYDKGPGKGAVVVAKADTFHSKGQKLFTNVFTLFSRKDGGFDGPKAPQAEFEFPNRPPDVEQLDKPSDDQPLLYRLSGDVFALHVDPEFARRSGFEKPILHGLCTYGYACRAVIRHLFPKQPERMRRFKVRFSKTLYPGTSIKTQIWKLDEGRAVFRTLNGETDEVVLDRGIVEWCSPEEAEKRAKRGAIHFENRVAIVTGAGAGLGREYALELARRGAKVVVNDLGGTPDGTGTGSSSAADQVVAEIKALGGEAVANYDSVAEPQGGQAIVEAALKHFGRVDILINNAGILRDKSLVKMTQADWDLVLKVHLFGAFHVTQRAFVAMKEQNYGRIVFTTSAAGLFGNFGQANYSAAKLGLVGLMNTLKLEGEKYNILVNTVAPVAGTRLTQGILPPDLFDKLTPQSVAALVLFLASEGCSHTGGIFNAGMGVYGRAAIVSGPGTIVQGEDGSPPTAEAIRQRIESISNMKGATEVPNATAFLGSMLKAFDPASKKQEPDPVKISVAQVFEKMPKAFQVEKSEGVDVIFQFNLSGSDGGDWFALIRDKTCQVESGLHPAPTTTIKMSAEDFLKLVAGKLKAMQAYSSGALKIEGDLMKSQLFEKLFSF